MKNETPWQDIATAPKDGTKILVWTTTRNSEELTSYCNDICEGVHVDEVQTATWDGEWDCHLIGEPTHWMPLPPPANKEDSQ
ncbi:DUF551 domain-containing protein [Sphingorhabdus sp. SMR4y]|uniref:DUF551 domain-containing protein n=1 Tax=Sphingorhabdus sp. SMR4y TaxID=2584094 RepID=UPI000B5C598C|nr:DUF551 domain-containing protein [Sphingorhabdus sp. SMR4y]ASK88444.1 hypothetical protein SPHFLASMR4Y_01697 [Sphingorhabdus sp. SMR4y]